MDERGSHREALLPLSKGVIKASPAAAAAAAAPRPSEKQPPVQVTLRTTASLCRKYTYLEAVAFLPALNGTEMFAIKAMCDFCQLPETKVVMGFCLFYCIASSNFILNKKEGCHEQAQILRDYE